MQNVELALQNFRTALVALVHYAPYLLVDKRGGFLGISLRAVIISADENLLLPTVIKQTDLFAHTPLGDHFAAALRQRLYVSARARAIVLYHQLLGDSAAQSHGYVV